MKSVYTLVLGLALVSGCNNDLGLNTTDGGMVIGKSPTELCDDLPSPPPGCGTATCAVDSECTNGMFCLNSFCIAICTPTEGCDSDEKCTSRGRCEQMLPDGSFDGGSCPTVEVQLIRIRPNVMFIVDQSGSMTRRFSGGDNRWEAAHDAISEVVENRSSIVNFGLTTFTETTADDQGPVPGSCPSIIEANLDFNLMSIADVGDYPRNFPGGGHTPTGESIEEVVQLLGMNPPPADGPTILVLATDGEPDTCTQHSPNEGQPESIAAAQAAYTAGFETFILSVGNDVAETHLNQMANVGIGRTPNDPNQAPAYRANTPAELQAAFDEIVGEQITCEVDLNAQVSSGANFCAGTVSMDGNVLTCNVDYRLKPGTNDTLELLGSACDTWKSTGMSLSSVFQCGVIVE